MAQQCAGEKENVDTEAQNLQHIRNYLRALENGEVGERLAPFFTENAMQVEFPNRLNPNGQKSDLANVLERSIQGQGMLSSQRYEVLTEVAQGNRVAVEANWVGVLAIPLGGLPAGFEMKAHFAMFFEMHEGRITSQHNYDCFEPWSVSADDS